jgi:hypothetical protein
MRKRSVLFTVILLLVLPACGKDNKQEQPASSEAIPQLTEVVSLSDLEIRTPHSVVVSPDASMLAWKGMRTSDGLCLLVFESNEAICTSYPDALESVDQMLVWSPDSHYLAFTEDSRDDTDIWIFSVADRTFSNRTDDDFSGSVDWTNENSHLMNRDVTPVWSPSGDLYFFRTVHFSDATHTVGPLNTIHRIPAADLLGDSEPKLVVDFSDKTIYAFPVFHLFNQWDSLQGSAAISSDGQRLAFLMRPTTNTEAAEWGVWVADLGSGSLEQVITREDLVEAMPEWAEPGVISPTGIAWTSAGQLLVASMSTAQMHAIPNNIYTYDFNTLSPMFDFGVATYDEFIAVNEVLDGYRLVDNSLYSAITTPDSKLLIAVQPEHPSDSNLPGRVLIYPLDSEQDSIQVGTFSDGINTTSISVGQNEDVIRMTVGGLLFTLSLE